MAQSSKLKAQKKGKLIIFSAPSGAGKTTIVKHLLQKGFSLEFSISATSREARHTETHGKDYYFLSGEEFLTKVENNEFLEWEEVYKGTSYGTLKSEVERIRNKGNNVIFDVDVVGGLNIKKYYGDEALAVFVQPPSVEELRNRLHGRSTDSEDKIAMRVAKAQHELSFASEFDVIITNDDLQVAFSEAERIISEFLSR
jgi:guanylate kinase